nr:hypothetical protein [Natronoarchaeum philippinense]
MVPLAWMFVAAAQVGVVADRTIFIALVVMSVLLAGFAVTGRPDMRSGTLLVWWRVIALGTVVTLSGVVGFLLDPDSGVLLTVALVGWMVLPAIGFVDTGRRVTEGTWVYTGGAIGSMLGTVLYLGGLVASTEWALLAGLVLVGIGQTAGILDATIRY